MRYVSIDIETTGLNPETCQIFEFAAIVDDTKKSNTVPRQSFQCFVVPEDGIIRGEAQGLMMNGQILERIAVRRSEDRFTFPRYLTQKFRQFLLERLRQ